MRHYGGMLGFIAVSQSRISQDVKNGGSMFKKKTTITVKGWVKPEWFVATPVEMQQEGALTSAICVSATATTTPTSVCDAPEHVAISGISITQWKGGNMPMDEEMVYQWIQTKSSFTIIFFAIILAVLTWGIALALTAAAPTMMASVLTTTGLGSAGLGIVAGIGYAVASTAMHSGGGLTQAQSGFFGATGNGVM